MATKFWCLITCQRQGCFKFHFPPPLGGGKEIKDPRGGEGKEKGKEICREGRR